MKFREINQKFTAKVAEYMTKGWYFNCGTMNGSQGEIAKADLTDGINIVRVVLRKDYGHERIDEKLFWSYDSIVLEVGMVNLESERVTPNNNDTWETIWNNKLEILERDEWYVEGKRRDWFVDRDEAIESYRKMIERYTARDRKIEKDITAVKGVAEVALKYAKRQPRCKSAKLADVKVTKREDGKFYVVYKDKKWRLG